MAYVDKMLINQMYFAFRLLPDQMWNYLVFKWF